MALSIHIPSNWAVIFIKKNYPFSVKVGKRHPDQIVETSSLASVLSPDVTYELKLPKSVINTGLLSALQLESIVYACQQHAHILPSGERAGFLIGEFNFPI